MKKQLATGMFMLGLLFLMAALLVSCGTPATAPPSPTATAQPVATNEPDEHVDELVDEHADELVGDPVRGGLLYDKFWVVIAADEGDEHGHEGDDHGPTGDAPEGDHPLWASQTTNTRSGTDTWRCKECHGWDYKGVNGAYGSGSHMTGFPGVFASQDKPVSEILGALKGSTSPDHDFSSMMAEQDLIDLALFISGSLVDTNALVNADKSSTGDAAQGETLYGEVCTLCHGPEGVAINFHGLDEPEYVTTIAFDNPWEFIHKVRFGQPGWPMPSAIVNEWTDADVANVLAYIQTLPEDSVLNLGGQLYDKWWVVAEVDHPEGDQPLWATQTTNERSGEDTWRCKECHGWDYKGADGAYGSGSHFTGFKGLLDVATMADDEVTAWLTGATDPDHDFSVMGDQAVGALVIFLREEVSDITPYVNADKTVIGDPIAGKDMFDNTCASCHGTDGKRLNFHDAEEPEYVGTIARDNPWEFFHKATFGQPGAPMPAGLALGWSMEEIANLLAFAQTLPSE